MWRLLRAIFISISAAPYFGGELMQKRRIVGAFVVAMLLFVSIGVAGVERENLNGSYESQTRHYKAEREISISLTFPTPSVDSSGEYAAVTIDGLSSISESGEPVLPSASKVLKFPLGTKILSIEVTPVHPVKIQIPKKIQPAYKPVVKGTSNVECTPDERTYESSAPYPSAWYRYGLGGGLSDGRHLTFLSLQFYPVRYYPAQNEVEYVNEININVKYEEPATPILNENLDVYDLVIIAPQAFESALQPLVDFKNSHGMKTVMKTVEDIMGEYSGRDGAEKVKYFIKDAVEEWGVKYVMLVGGKKSMWTGNWGMDGPNKVDDSLWWCPVRYSALKDYMPGSWGEDGYLSDLYFADIYDAYGNFSSWDSNGNGKFAEWTEKATDTRDLYPDVYVGRLPARNEGEVKTMVDKIVAYESSPADPSWFNRMLLVGGDTFPGDPAGVYDGEYATTHEFGFMPSQFTATKLYVSDGSLMGGKSGKLAARFAWRNVVKTMSEGFGFVAFDGHGSPTVWATHPVGDNGTWVNGLMTYQMELLKNGNKLPIVSVGGCHNSEFNISFFDFSKNEWTYQPTFECWSWRLMRTGGGGSIATIGYTGLGYGMIGDEDNDGIPDTVERFGGYIEGQFFYMYGVEGKHTLGDCFDEAIQNYLNKFPINWSGQPESDTQIDCKTVEEWTLMGDPSLQIGGYS